MEKVIKNYKNDGGIKWVATVHGDDNPENDIIKIGVQQYEDDYRDTKQYDLIASNGDDVSQGGFDTEDAATEAIYKAWAQWDTLEAIDND